jgi:hypothetical protein
MAVTGRSNLCDVDGLFLLHETGKAYLVDNGKTKAWLPKSMVEFDGRDTFTMPDWLAVEKGLV